MGNGEKMTFGVMEVALKNAKSIKGPGTLKSDESGQVWFDYSGKDYPSSIDWKKATVLTFTPSMGNVQTFWGSETEYFFNSGWVAPRLVLKKPDRI
jgi:hypothetical protein